VLRVRAELLADGGPALWEDFMAELRSEHLGAPHRRATARPRASAWPPPTLRPSPSRQIEATFSPPIGARSVAKATRDAPAQGYPESPSVAADDSDVAG